MLAGAAAVSLIGGVVVTSVGGLSANAAPTGQGFTVSAADLSYILEQIQIAEAHVENTTSLTGPCGALLGNGPHQIPSPLLSFGLRTVDGSCNNLQPGQETFGAADQAFPRLTTPFFRPAEAAVVPGLGPVGGPGLTSYAQTNGSVVDSEPRTISNLIVDQTSTNPAAIAAAGFPVRTQGNLGVVPCDDHGNPPPPALECVPEFETLFMPNVTTDIGLSPPYNSLFTIFGQFFDHGLDKITNGGAGAVFVPLKADDPLIPGADHILGTSDDLPLDKRFMVLTRGTIVTGPDGKRSAPNTDTPFVDQSQTYTSHSSHQVFLRDYVSVANKPVATGKFLSSTDGGLATWAMIKDQAASRLGMKLVDTDVNDIPMIAADVYGNFIPGPNGLPQYVTQTGLVEGNLANPVAAPGNVKRIGTAFLNDIAHSAAPTAGGPDFVPEAPGPDGILVDLPATAVGGDESADNTPAVPADAGADGVFGTDCDTDAPSPECADDIPAIPEGPGPDLILLDDPNTFAGGDESADNIAAHDDDVAGGSLDTPVPAGTYDDELLDLHFICGDGRCNENIALSAIHQVFHTEHDRLVDDIQSTLDDNPGLLAAYAATSPTTFEYGERLFQAARFVTEMEYQHLVFEEFARKVQPAINPFEPFAFNQTDVNPAITAEFAHAVYRFGHSMLTETIARTNVDGSQNDIPLLDGFLNPASYNDGGPAGALSSQEAAGSIIMGMSDQVGNELDEFVTDTLRNHLLGLPLDLASINMARARSEGIPSLNNVRKQLFAATNDGQLTPYKNWIDFGLGLKHPESLVNFVAAYGQHPSITSKANFVDKREAARLMVAPETGDIQPGDTLDFLGSTGPAWSNLPGNVSRTGVDGIDLWVGGLAEITNPFGGLLGTTFNYVFENQLTNLQNGDRFYYLGRTPGMNLRSQLEGNSFAEMMMRNTTAHTLKADPFATADCKFQLGSNPGIAGPISGTNIVNDPDSECDEHRLLIRMPGGQIRYRPFNAIDPPGINGQSVYNGTAGADNIFGGNDNDTFLGNEGNDIIDGGAGDDVPLGGDGNDIITDLAGADVLKGGPDNDALDGGIGDDILMGGDGSDFTNGGANLNEAFLGAGNDFAIAGQGLDAVFGDSGDDWMEGGDMADLLIGDSSTLFFDDHNIPGHDVTIGQGGDDDYDTEGGDDILVAGPGVEKNAGAAGFDWSIGLGDPQKQLADLSLPILPEGQPAIEVRDRFNEVEALSGWNLNDELHGDDVVPFDVGGGGFIGCDALDQDGLDRISGLDPLVPPLTVDPASAVAATTTRYCGLEGNVWGDGNILLGGAGSDLIEGRGANDIIDGDKYLNVRLSVRTDVNNPATQIGSTDLMEHAAVVGDFGLNTTGMTLQQAVFAGLVDPGKIAIVREILSPTASAPDCAAATPVNCDTAVFSGAFANYTITNVLAASGNLAFVQITDTAGTDGVDIVRNVERLQFTDTTVSFGLPGAPTIGQALAGNARATVNFTAPINPTIPPITGFSVRVTNATTLAVVRTIPTGNVATFVVGSGAALSNNPPLVNGTPYTFAVAAVNLAGAGAFSAESNTVTPAAAPAPVLIQQVPASGGVNFPVANNITARFSAPMTGVSALTNTTALNGSTNVKLFVGNPANNLRVPATVSYAVLTSTVTINPTANLAPSTLYTVVITGGSCVAPIGGIRTLIGTCAAFATTSWSFTTEVANPAPTVISTNPAANAVNVNRKAGAVTATFSENVQGVTSTTATIARTGGGVIAATVSYNSTTHVLTITPAANLRANTGFTVTLRGGATAIRDTTNQPLVTKTWSFTTGA